MPGQSSGDSVHAVAYALLERVALAEQWDAAGSNPATGRWHKSRQEILDTYKECLRAVRGSSEDKYSH